MNDRPQRVVPSGVHGEFFGWEEWAPGWCDVVEAIPGRVEGVGLQTCVVNGLTVGSSGSGRVSMLPEQCANGVSRPGSVPGIGLGAPVRHHAVLRLSAPGWVLVNVATPTDFVRLAGWRIGQRGNGLAGLFGDGC